MKTNPKSLLLSLSVSLCCLVSGCGGTQTSQNNLPPQQPSPPSLPTKGPLGPSRQNLLFGFFGSDDTQEETFPWTNCWIEMCWGDSDPSNPIVAVYRLTRAKAAGGTRCILSVEWLLFDMQGQHKYRGDQIVRPLLTTFLTTLKAHNLLDMIEALYVCDEPDLHGIPIDDIRLACESCLAVAATFPELEKIGLSTTYAADRTWPGLQYFRPGIIGVDDYGKRESILLPGSLVPELISLLAEDQEAMVFPGGANPWRQDPIPFYQYAQVTPKVRAIMGFVWIDNRGGGTDLGVCSNGLKDVYAEVGTAICPPDLKGADASKSKPV